MANFAKIEIEFTDFTSAFGAELKIRFAGPATYDLTWVSVVLRTGAFQYTVSASEEFEQTTFAFAAIQADIANHGVLSSKMTVTQTGGTTITIEANEFGWALTDNGTDAAVEATLTPTAEVEPAKDFQLTGYSLATAVDPCADVEVTITENGDGVAPYEWIDPVNASVTLVADLARQATTETISITIEDDEADQATLTNVIIPKISNSTDIDSISVVTNPGGFDATVTIFMVDASGDLFSYQFSLDGSSFQTSNVFPNLVDDNYTLYVDDGFGCIFTDTFEVDTEQSVERILPHGVVPKAQSFRFVQLVSSQYNTLENTLYQDEVYLGEHKPDYFQPYQTNDGIITSQFQSNYDELSARLIDCNDEIIDTFSITQQSDNLGAQDKRDCIAFNRGDNQSGVYFTTGNIYDPGTTDIIDTYELNGNLPEWGVIGNTMVLSGNIVGSFVIKQVVFDSTVQAKALIFDFAWQSGNQSEAVIAEVTYNRLPYETYEFDFDLGQSPLLSGNYFLQILMTDSLDEYPALTFNSESIQILNEHKRTNFIDYSVSPNSGLDYSTGFTGRVRLLSLDPYADLEPGGESTEYNDALLETVKLKDSATMEGVMFFQAVPRYMIEKLRLIFTHKTISINGEGWTNIEGLETINFRKSSLKNATIKLRRNNYEEYKQDNIDVDGDKAVILQDTGSLLINE